MRVHYIQHVSFEGLGCMADLLAARECTVSRTAMFENSALPDPKNLDALIIMGGPMSVHDEAQYPWLAAEKNFVRMMIRLGVPVLGVCLGAQLIASALGARVFPNNVKEIGWFSIRGTQPDSTGFQFGPDDMVFHWHGETFDLPDGAIRLAESRVCRNQAFQIGKAIGLQFHLEATPESVHGMLTYCADELVDGPWIQTTEAMTQLTAQHASGANLLMKRLLDYLLFSGA